jgi:hypothetical protein
VTDNIERLIRLADADDDLSDLHPPPPELPPGLLKLIKEEAAADQALRAEGKVPPKRDLQLNSPSATLRAMSRAYLDALRALMPEEEDADESR